MRTAQPNDQMYWRGTRCEGLQHLAYAPLDLLQSPHQFTVWQYILANVEGTQNIIDSLYINRSGKDLAITNCLAKVQLFCEQDAYPAYDAVGKEFESVSDTFQSELLTATNAAMRARSSRKAWEPMLDTPLPALANIPTDIDLIECSDAEWNCVRQLLGEFYLEIANVRWITDMAVSKMLYLKRPKLAAISDSYVREALAIAQPDTAHYPWKPAYCAERALIVSDAVRAVGKANVELLTNLQASLEAYTLSKARLVDILIWVDMAILRDHPAWKQAAAARGWKSAFS